MVETYCSNNLIDVPRAKQRYIAEDRSPSAASLLVNRQMLLNKENQEELDALCIQHSWEITDTCLKFVVWKPEGGRPLGTSSHNW